MRNISANTLFDICAGAAIGVLLTAYLLLGDMNTRQMAFDSAAPITTVLTLLGVIVCEFSVGAALSGAVIRMIAEPQNGSSAPQPARNPIQSAGDQFAKQNARRIHGTRE